MQTNLNKLFKKNVIKSILISCLVLSYTLVGAQNAIVDKVKLLDNLIGKWSTVEKVYDADGNVKEDIKALTKCEYVLGNSHISLIGYNKEFKANDESSIWHISYVGKEQLFYVRGLFPNIGRMDVFKGNFEGNQLTVLSDPITHEGKTRLFKFDINLSNKNKIVVQAIRISENKETLMRYEEWNRIYK